MPWSQGWWVLWPWSWRWKWSGLTALQLRKPSHTQACPLPFPSFLSLLDVYMSTCWKHDPIYFSYCIPGFWFCHLSFVCSGMSCVLQPFVFILTFGNFFLVGWFLCTATCILVSLLVVTLLRHACKMRMRWVWLRYHSGTKYLHAAIGYTF